MIMIEESVTCPNCKKASNVKIKIYSKDGSYYSDSEFDECPHCKFEFYPAVYIAVTPVYAEVK